MSCAHHHLGDPKEVRPLTTDGRDLWRSMGIHDRVCPLVKALYGHPDAWGYWEQHCNAHLAKCGCKEGVVTVISKHSTCSIMLNEWEVRHSDATLVSNS